MSYFSWETPEQQIKGLGAALDHERGATAKLRAAIVDALIPLLHAYADLPGYPEAFTAIVERATGLKGGNHSHGGELRISFATGQGANHVDCEDVPERDERKAILIAKGDMEQDGLVDALVGLLAELLPVYRRHD